MSRVGDPDPGDPDLGGPVPVRAKETFLQALELDGPDRARFLERLQAEDERLAGRVRRLLAAHGDLDDAWTAGVSSLARNVLPREDRRSPGRRIGDYDLIEEVGSGASGVVWKANQISLGRQVAVKLLRSGPFASEREVNLFRAEAEAVARLDHPGIVPVHEVGQVDGRPYFSMRWVDGNSLAKRLGRAWPARDAVRLVVSTARAVHHAHQRGLLHRDLKPSNVLIDRAGEPHVVDFGIAKAMDSDETASPTGALLGTPRYMAPEQTRLASELTVATDVWALGCILYELLSGHPAFEGRDVSEIFFQINEREPRRLAVPRDLATIVLTCLRKEVSARYASAEALADDLDRWLTHQPIRARRTGVLERVWLYWKRSPLVATLLVATASLTIALAVGGIWTNRRLQENLRTALLGEARATRLTATAGRRTRSLDLLARAARLRPGDDLRNEAVAALALTDLVHEERLLGDLGGTLALDARLERLAVADGAGFVHVRRLRSDEAPLSLELAGSARALKFSRDGGFLLAVADHDAGQRTLVWDLRQTSPRIEVETALDFDAYDVSPGGRWLAVGSMDGTLSLYDLATGARVFRRSKGGIVSAIDFHPSDDALLVATGGGVDTVEVTAVTGEVLDALQLAEGSFRARWSADGASVAIACGDFNAYLWKPGDEAPPRALIGHSAEVTKAEFCAGDTLVATSSWDGTVRLWEARSGTELSRVPGTFPFASADGLRVAVTRDGGLELYRIELARVLRVLRGGHEGKQPTDLIFDPAGRPITFGERRAHVWSLEPWPHIDRTAPAWVHAFRYGPAGGRVLARTDAGLELLAPDDWSSSARVADGELTTFDLSRGGETVVVCRSEALDVVFPDDPTSNHRIPVDPTTARVRVSPDGRWIVAGSWGGRGARVWRAASGELAATLVPEQSSPYVAVSPDSRTVLLGLSTGYELWSLETRELEWRLDTATGIAGACTFWPDGSRVLTTVGGGLLAILDAGSGAPILRLEPPEPRPVTVLRVSADGQLLAAVSPGNHALVWNLAEIEERLERLGLARR